MQNTLYGKTQTSFLLQHFSVALFYLLARRGEGTNGLEQKANSSTRPSSSAAEHRLDTQQQAAERTMHHYLIMCFVCAVEGGGGVRRGKAWRDNKAES